MDPAPDELSSSAAVSEDALLLDERLAQALLGGGLHLGGAAVDFAKLVLKAISVMNGTVTQAVRPPGRNGTVDPSLWRW